MSSDFPKTTVRFYQHYSTKLPKEKPGTVIVMWPFHMCQSVNSQAPEPRRQQRNKQKTPIKPILHKEISRDWSIGSVPYLKRWIKHTLIKFAISIAFFIIKIMKNIIKASDFTDFSLLQHSALQEVSLHSPQLFSCCRAAIEKG